MYDIGLLVVGVVGVAATGEYVILHILLCHVHRAYPRRQTSEEKTLSHRVDSFILCCAIPPAV